MKKPNFIEWNNKILISSLKKIDLNIILIIILDTLFYLLSGYFIIFWLQRVQVKMETFNLPTDIISLGSERAQQLVSEVKTFYFLIIFSFILLLLAIIFLASIVKGIIWAKTTRTKISFALISKFLALNLIWMGFWFVLIFLISWLVDPSFAPIIMVGAIFLGVYFTNTLYTLFMNKQKIGTIKYSVKLTAKKTEISPAYDMLVATRLAAIDFLNTLKQIQIFTSIRDTFKINILKIHLFLLPYAIVSLLFYIILKLTSLIKFKYSTILLVLVMVIYAALVRYYISTLILEIEGTK